MKNANLLKETIFGIILGIFGWLYLIVMHEIQILLFSHLPEHLHWNKSISTIVIMSSMIGILSLIIYRKGSLNELNQKFNEALEQKKFNSIFFVIVTYFVVVLVSGVGVGPEASLISIIVMVNKYRRNKNSLELDKKTKIIHIVVILITIVIAFRIDGIKSGFYTFNEFIVGQNELLVLPILIILSLVMIKGVDVIAKKTENKLANSRIKKHHLPLIGGAIFIGVIMLTNIPQYNELHINHLLLFSGESGIVDFAKNSGQISPEYGLMIGILKFLMFIVLVNSGLKGGAYFPYMFGAFAISYYLSIKFGINFGFTAIIFVTAALAIPNSKQVWLSAALVPLYFAWSSLLIIIPLCIFYSFIGTKMNIGKVIKH